VPRQRYSRVPRYPLDRRLGGPQSRFASVVQPGASRYADCAIPAPGPRLGRLKTVLGSDEMKNLVSMQAIESQFSVVHALAYSLY
jgi:hypothetical protein